MLLGYNTSGFAFHRLDDALEIIAGTGYTCVALTLDVHHFNPFEATPRDRSRLKRRLDELNLACVIETGARFLLDPRRKHRPTLLDEDDAARQRFLLLAIELCGELGGKCVSYWSGAVPQGTPPGAAARRDLVARLAGKIDAIEIMAKRAGVTLAFEPEPGFLIATMADFDELCGMLGRRIGLTLDIGHLQCVETQPPETFIPRYRDVLFNVQLDDMKRGEHRHLMFGEGEIDFVPVFRALRDIGYTGPACVELSDASRDAVHAAQSAGAFLRKFV